MTEVKKGSVVKVHYTGKLQDGTIFGSSVKREPLEFEIGDSQVISGFQNAVMGMEPGETRTVTVPASQAYGKRDLGQVHVLARNKFPPDVKVGQQYQLAQTDQEPETVTVVKVAENEVTVDGNHPLAGRDLLFDIELLEVA
jgi:peptidylprolyl isomerase